MLVILMPSNHDRVFKSIIIERQTVTVYEKPHRKIFLLGTNHLDAKSARAIKKLIAFADPDVVAVELCLERLKSANIFGDRRTYEEKYRDLINIPMKLRRKATSEMTRLLYAHKALQSSQESQSRSMRHYKVKPIDIDGLTIAGDVFMPFRDYVWTLEPNKICLSCREVTYKILLADVPISETCSKLAHVFSSEEKKMIRKYRENFVDMFSKNNGSLMGRIWHKNDRIKKIMIDERNERLSESILNASQVIKNHNKRQIKVVAIVGHRHVDGILQKWKSKSS